VTYEVVVKNHAAAHEIEADHFTHDKGGLTFFKGTNSENAPVAVAFFPSSDVEFVKEKK
jgi:hypothetical protein